MRRSIAGLRSRQLAGSFWFSLVARHFIVVCLQAGCNDGATLVGPATDASAPSDGHDGAEVGARDGGGGGGGFSSSEGNDGSEGSAGHVRDASSDDAAQAPPTCGDPPARYTLLTGSGDGLARDNVTMLVWMRESQGGGEPPQTQPLATAYCSGLQMRLPTKDEAADLAANYAACAFGHWATWTSTESPVIGYAWVVDYLGDATVQVADNFPSAVLCVRSPAP